MTDVMQQPWACTLCHWKGVFGQLRVKRGKPAFDGGVVCPSCKRFDGIHPADGTVKTLDEYNGEIGTRN
jgi:hypothetical protein